MGKGQSQASKFLEKETGKVPILETNKSYRNIRGSKLSACVSTETCADPASQKFNSVVNSLLLECVSKSREDSLLLLAFG